MHKISIKQILSKALNWATQDVFITFHSYPNCVVEHGWNIFSVTVVKFILLFATNWNVLVSSRWT